MAIIFLFKQDHKKYEIILFIETKEGTKFDLNRIVELLEREEKVLPD